MIEKSAGDGKERLDKTNDNLSDTINHIQKDNTQSLTDLRNKESIGGEVQILNQYLKEVRIPQGTTKSSKFSSEWKEMLRSALTDLSWLHQGKSNISAYELNSSGLMLRFLKLFGSVPSQNKTAPNEPRHKHEMAPHEELTGQGNFEQVATKSIKKFSLSAALTTELIGSQYVCLSLCRVHK